MALRAINLPDILFRRRASKISIEFKKLNDHLWTDVVVENVNTRKSLSRRLLIKREASTGCNCPWSIDPSQERSVGQNETASSQDKSGFLKYFVFLVVAQMEMSLFNIFFVHLPEKNLNSTKPKLGLTREKILKRHPITLRLTSSQDTFSQIALTFWHLGQFVQVWDHIRSQDTSRN